MISYVSMLSTDETKWIAFGQVKVIQVYGYNPSGTNDRWIQFHAKPNTAIANADVPFSKSIWAPASAPFSWTFAQPITLSELSIGISDAEANYSAITADTGVDMTIVVESEFLVGSSTTLVGDLTSAVANLQVWAEASGPKHLRRLDVVNNSGNVAFIVIEASDSAVRTSQPLPPIKMAVGETKNLHFGVGGLIPYRLDADKTVRKGCTVRMALESSGTGIVSITSDGLYTFDGVANYAIRAIYE